MDLGFDIDGVISDFVKAFSESVKKKYGVTLKEADIYCHDLNLVLGITKNERNQLITETLKKDLALNHGAKETLEKLFSEGHKIYLLTARFGVLAKVTKDWLKRKGIPYTELLQLTEGEKYHANVNLDLMVEDCLQDALEWSQKAKNILVYDHPWNKTLNVNNLIKRVYSWDEIYEEVQQLKASSIRPPSLIR
jgi:uncharacterized HAD superfamily protein